MLFIRSGELSPPEQGFVSLGNDRYLERIKIAKPNGRDFSFRIQ